MPNDLAHILALSPEEQLTMKLLTQNYVKMMTKLHMSELLKSNNERDLDDRWSRYCRMFDGYEELTSHMPSPHAFEGTKTRLFSFSGRGIKSLSRMFDIYDPNKSALDPDAIPIIESNLDDLKKKIDESAKYQFSSEEIKRAFNQ